MRGSPSFQVEPCDDLRVELLSVGDVAARLGVTPSTVRMWGQRYGLRASAQSPGGHRRYTAEDVVRLQQMHDEVIAGTSPAAAAAGVLPRDKTGRSTTGAALGAMSQAAPRPRPGGPGGSVLAVPGAGRAARGLARAAFRLDEMGVEDAVVAELRKHGTLATWNEVLRPVLVASGEYWQRTGEGVEIEHLLTQAVTTAFVRHTSAVGELTRNEPVLLAGGPQEEHTLALHAVRAGLAERGVPGRLLGPRTPIKALTAAARRTRAPAVLVWLSLTDLLALHQVSEVSSAHRRITVFLGGPGWGSANPTSTVVCATLDEAVRELRNAWLARRASKPRD